MKILRVLRFIGSIVLVLLGLIFFLLIIPSIQPAFALSGLAFIRGLGFLFLLAVLGLICFYASHSIFPSKEEIIKRSIKQTPYQEGSLLVAFKASLSKEDAKKNFEFIPAWHFL